MRRVVTGEDEQGRSVIVHDGEPPHSVFLESIEGSRISEEAEARLAAAFGRGGSRCGFS